MDEGEGGHGEAGDQPNEPISSIDDYGVFAEEDEDCNNLYNYVNIREDIIQSFQRNEDSLPAEGHGGRGGGGGGGGGDTVIHVDGFCWWTTDAELEAEFCKYGEVKELIISTNKSNGKSNGCCEVQYFDPLAATACMKGMNGRLFNGKQCVVFSPRNHSLKTMEESHNTRNQPMIGNFGRGNNFGMGSEGLVNPMSNNGRGIGVAPLMIRPRPMINQSFNPAFGLVGGMGGLPGHPGGLGDFPGHPGGLMRSMGGFPSYPGGLEPAFSGMLPSYHGDGLLGVAPRVNPAIYGRGMTMSGMRMIPPSMYAPNMGGSCGDEHGSGMAAESSYAEEAALYQQYDEVNHDRAGGLNVIRENYRELERDFSGPFERKFEEDRYPECETDLRRERYAEHDREERRNRDDREIGRWRSQDSYRSQSRDHDCDRDMHGEDRDMYTETDHQAPYNDEWERWRPSRTPIKSQSSTHKKKRRSRKDSNHGKRRRRRN